MDDETLVYDRVGTGREMSIWVGAGLTLDEVRQAAAADEAVRLVIAQVGGGREQVRMIPVTRVQNIQELPGGFTFNGATKQPIFYTRIDDNADGEATIGFQVRDSVCRVTVCDGEMKVEFVTQITTSDITGMFDFVSAAMAQGFV